jgi:hypothetical protein
MLAKKSLSLTKLFIEMSFCIGLDLLGTVKQFWGELQRIAFLI